MCGISGVFRKDKNIDFDGLNKAISTLNHRGPDNQSTWFEANIGLAHARLSIQDTSSVANQPMFSLSQRFVIVFNGEIYNYLDLRKELIAEYNICFKTHSDTEVLVNAIELWGIEKTLKKCVGMFAFAVWDRLEKRLFLARDRFGEKPLYYGVLNGDFVFASELKAITACYKEYMHIDRNVLSTYMQYCYVPAPYSIYAELKKLEPGSFLVINNAESVDKYFYWSAVDAALKAKIDVSFDEASRELEKLLLTTLSQQMLSDVPLGAFLSGGVDSSTIVALMQSLSSQPIKTFSIGFYEKQYDESAYAREVAKYLKTNHTEMYLADHHAMSVIPNLATIYDEPFADSSQIPTFLVSELAKKSVTVVLSGDAGDEVFGGYSRYFLAHRVKAILGNPVLNQLIRICPQKIFDIFDVVPQSLVVNLSGKLKKAQTMAKSLHVSFANMYKGFCTQINENFVLQGQSFLVVDNQEYINFSKYLSDIESMMLIDALNYLTDDILVKIDRAAMANSLETRVPFLDHRVFEFAWALPEKYKVVHGKGKLILRDILYRYVPKELIERPKMGFGVPLEKWLRGGLKDWVEDLLDETKLHQQGFLDPMIVRRYWDEHQKGKCNRQGVLWNILMFQQWMKCWNT